MKMTCDDAMKEFGAILTYRSHLLIFSIHEKKKTSEVMKFLNGWGGLQFRMSRSLKTEFNAKTAYEGLDTQSEHIRDLIFNYFELNEGERNQKLRDSVEEYLLDHLVDIHEEKTSEKFLRAIRKSDEKTPEDIRKEYQSNPVVRNFISSLECLTEADIADEIQIPDAVLNVGDNIYQSPESFLSYMGVCTVPYQITERMLVQSGVDSEYDIKYIATHSVFENEDNPTMVEFSINDNGEVVPDFKKSNFPKKVGYGSFFLSEGDAVQKSDDIAVRLGAHLEKWEAARPRLGLKPRTPA